MDNNTLKNVLKDSANRLLTRAAQNRYRLEKRVWLALVAAALLLGAACSAHGQRGIADKRSDFRKFIPMNQDPYRDGLKLVRPYFRTANRQQILNAIERACTGGKSGSSVFDPRTQQGYYVNCNPRNRQLLNGYIPANPAKEPRGHR